MIGHQFGSGHIVYVPGKFPFPGMDIGIVFSVRDHWPLLTYIAGSDNIPPTLPDIWIFKCLCQLS